MSGIPVQLSNLTVYYGQTPAIAGVCLDVAEGEYLGIVGPNGGGKSTLLKTILGLVPVASGSVQIYGDSPTQKRITVGYVPQFASVNKRFPISPFEVVLTGRLKRGLAPFFKFTKEDKDIVQEVLEKVGIEDLAKRQISELSGGQFQRMLIARALALDPKLLLLDEPTASVDTRTREQIYSLLAELNKKMTIILVTHDMFAISSQVQKLACLNGRLVYYGKPVLTNSTINSLYNSSAEIIKNVTDGSNRQKEVKEF